MRIIKPSAELLWDFDGAEYLRRIELAGRVCYQSTAKGDSAEKFVRMLIKRGHESVLEHCSATFKIICDRGVMAELTRHRLASFSVESTRYCKYDELTFIEPYYWDRTHWREEDGNSNVCYAYSAWEEQMLMAEDTYGILIEREGATPEQARSVLPNSLKVEMVMTANLREWRHILKLRTDKKAHPQMRQVAGMILAILKEKLPPVFEDIGGEQDAGSHIAGKSGES